MKKLLSHVNTKKEFAEYFAQKIIEMAQRMGRNAVVSWVCERKGTTRSMIYLKSDQEEADTKIILHALDVTTNGATEIKIHSPDTDVFILALRRFPRLCENTVFVTGKANC
jgi:imidazole glycerol phosphate synthase subunit HisF